MKTPILDRIVDRFVGTEPGAEALKELNALKHRVSKPSVWLALEALRKMEQNDDRKREIQKAIEEINRL